MHHVYVKDAYKASINKLDGNSNNFDPSVPWALLHNSGKTRRFGSFAEAKDEAQKVYPGAKIKRS